jgi:hypothetical protein
MTTYVYKALHALTKPDSKKKDLDDFLIIIPN